MDERDDPWAVRMLHDYGNVSLPNELVETYGNESTKILLIKGYQMRYGRDEYAPTMDTLVIDKRTNAGDTFYVATNTIHPLQRAKYERT